MQVYADSIRCTPHRSLQQRHCPILFTDQYIYSMQIFIETERLIVRELVPSDDQGMFLLDSDPEVHRYLGNKPVQTIKQAREIIAFIRQQYIANGIGRWAVVKKETNEFVGWTGLKLIKEPLNKHSNFYDVGYRLIKKYWGKVYATESARASIDYGFNKLGLREIYAMADVQNDASNKVLQKVGLRFVETFLLDGVLHNWFKIAKS